MYNITISKRQLNYIRQHKLKVAKLNQIDLSKWTRDKPINLNRLRRRNNKRELIKRGWLKNG